MRKQSHKLKYSLICHFEICLLVVIIIVIGQNQFKVFAIFFTFKVDAGNEQPKCKL